MNVTISGQFEMTEKWGDETVIKKAVTMTFSNHTICTCINSWKFYQGLLVLLSMGKIQTVQL